jgi:hypothetical protein
VKAESCVVWVTHQIAVDDELQQVFLKSCFRYFGRFCCLHREVHDRPLLKSKENQNGGPDRGFFNAITHSFMGFHPGGGPSLGLIPLDLHIFT